MFFRKNNKPAGPVDFLIAGLGNPGRKYEGTRHNIGFAVIEALSARLSAPVKKIRFQSLCGEARIEDKRVLLMMPQTYMNNSGIAVREAMRFYKLAPEQLLVVCDEVALPAGAVRIRRSGSDGGQKGMASILYHLQSDQFPRIRIGVGAKPHPDYELADWVLSKFSPNEAKVMVEAVDNASAAVVTLVGEGIERAMNLYSK
ncbi:MAG: aminoacyl-tRNA hydrolase [Oscillospiraceae bacterium]|nr:aminoacyl-tRNA hydrolase [Oscillospiraceae bacterium]